MESIANLWWLWLLGSVVTLLYGGYNQVSRMKRMMKGDVDTFSNGLYALFAAAVVNMGFVVLLITAIVLNVIEYAKR